MHWVFLQHAGSWLNLAVSYEYAAVLDQLYCLALEYHVCWLNERNIKLLLLGVKLNNPNLQHNLPTVNRPMIRQPATEVWITGMVSANSDSNTLKKGIDKVMVQYIISPNWMTRHARIQNTCRSFPIHQLQPNSMHLSTWRTRQFHYYSRTGREPPFKFTKRKLKRKFRIGYKHVWDGNANGVFDIQWFWYEVRLLNYRSHNNRLRSPWERAENKPTPVHTT